MKKAHEIVLARIFVYAQCSSHFAHGPNTQSVRPQQDVNIQDPCFIELSYEFNKFEYLNEIRYTRSKYLFSIFAFKAEEKHACRVIISISRLLNVSSVSCFTFVLIHKR